MLSRVSTQQFVDRLPRVTGGEVPQHAVDGVEGMAARVHEALGVPQSLPDVLAIEGVDADDHRHEPGPGHFGLPFELGRTVAAGPVAVGIEGTVGVQAQLELVGRCRRVSGELDDAIVCRAAAFAVGEEAGQTGRHLVHAGAVGESHLAQLRCRLDQVEGGFSDFHDVLWVR